MDYENVLTIVNNISEVSKEHITKQFPSMYTKDDALELLNRHTQLLLSALKQHQFSFDASVTLGETEEDLTIKIQDILKDGIHDRANNMDLSDYISYDNPSFCIVGGSEIEIDEIDYNVDDDWMDNLVQSGFIKEMANDIVKLIKPNNELPK